MKNKDLLVKAITSIQRHEGGWTFVVIRKDGLQQILVAPHLESPNILTSKMQQDTNACLVILNSRKNLDVVADHWQEFAKYPKLCIIFANPDSNTDKRWIIFPHTHDKITERKTLKRGLESLFLTVDEAR